MIARMALILCCAAAIVAAQFIGVQRFTIGGVTIVLLPLVFAFIAGALLNPNVISFWRRWIGSDVGHVSSRLVAPAVMPLVILLSAGIGDEFAAVVQAGPALLLQEIGNLGTMALAMPAAVILFGMGREAIGATFSIAREGGLAFIFDRYGPNTPEAAGVTAIYVCGTFLGAAFFSVLAPIVAATGLLDIRALAMACGTGSASMTAACSTALIAVRPTEADLIGALAASSTLLTGVTGLFFTIFVTMPAAEALFAALTRLRGKAA